MSQERYIESSPVIANETLAALVSRFHLFGLS
jgi:hypothetical protein